MSLLVSPLANLIGDGAAAENGDYLDFMQIDENTYSRTFLFLKAQRTIIQGISDQIHTINNTKKDDHIAINSKIEGLTQKLLESSFGEVFENAKDAIPIIRNIINREDDLNINEKKISQKLLSSSIALSRVFSIIASSLPTCSKCENSKDAKDQKNEHNYVPDLNDVLVLCRICEEYVPLSQIEEHSKICVKAAESEVKIMSLDDRISKLQNSIKKIILKPNWPSKKKDCVELLLPMFHVVMLLDRTLKVQTSTLNDLQILSVIFKSINQIKVRVDNQNVESMLDKAINLIYQKLKVCSSTPGSDAFLQAMNISPNFGFDYIFHYNNDSNFSENPQLHSSRIDVTISDFDFIKLVSSGAYARVFLGQKKKTGDIYAIKVIPRSSLQQKNQMQRILTEKDILLQNENPYIVNFFYSFIGFHNLYLVMEFLPGGDLYSLLQNVGSLNEDYVKVYTAQIVMALQSLHKRGIVHRDIKPDNILITETGKIKLTDFGLSMLGTTDRNLMDDDQSKSQQTKLDNESIVGTPDYLAPEVILAQPHTFTADYWSLGVVVYELLTGIPPFHRETESDTFSAIIIGKVDYAELDYYDCSPEVKSFISSLLNSDPKQRLGANGIQEIMNHPWFKGIDWANLDLLEPPFVPHIEDKHSTDYFTQRYTMNQQEHGDIIQDFELAKDQSYIRLDRDNNNNANELRNFISIDFKSLSKANYDAANKIRKNGTVIDT